MYLTIIVCDTSTINNFNSTKPQYNIVVGVNLLIKYAPLTIGFKKQNKVECTTRTTYSGTLAIKDDFKIIRSKCINVGHIHCAYVQKKRLMSNDVTKCCDKVYNYT